MIAGYLHPGKPMANMYFVLYSYSKFTSMWLRDMGSLDLVSDTVSQASLLLRDLKIAQCRSSGRCWE